MKLLSYEEILALVKKDHKAHYTPPPIDNLIMSNQWRTLTVEFTAKPGWRFGIRKAVMQPHHIENVYDERRDEYNEVTVWDGWDEDTWVERGLEEAWQDYARQLYNAQNHLAIMQGLEPAA